VIVWRPSCHSTVAIDPLRGRRLGLVLLKLVLATRHLPGDASAEIDGARCAAPAFFTSLTGSRLGRDRPHTWWCATLGHIQGFLTRTGRIPAEQCRGWRA